MTIASPDAVELLTIRIGQVRITFIPEEPAYPAERDVFFPQLATQPQDPDAWFLQPPWAIPSTDRVILNQQLFLVRTADRVILLDAGGGNDKDRKGAIYDHSQRPVLDHIRRAGVALEDIDTVLFSHLHIDHVGFATSLVDGAWVPTFPNARYLVVPEELEFWTGPGAIPTFERAGDHIADSITPLQEAGVLDLVEAGTQLTPEIRLIPAFGHTPGNLFIEIESGGRRAIHAGDGIHNGIQLAHPDWSIRYCEDPIESARQRRALLESIADTDTILIPGHFPAPTAGYVLRDGDAFRYRFIDPAELA